MIDALEAFVPPEWLNREGLGVFDMRVVSDSAGRYGRRGIVDFLVEHACLVESLGQQDSPFNFVEYGPRDVRARVDLLTGSWVDELERRFDDGWTPHGYG